MALTYNIIYILLEYSKEKKCRFFFKGKFSSNAESESGIKNLLTTYCTTITYILTFNEER